MKRISSRLYRPLSRLVITLLILEVVNWTISQIPLLRGQVIPGVFISGRGIISAIIGVITIIVFLRFRKDFISRLRTSFPTLPQLGKMVSAAVNFGIIIITYSMFDVVILPFLRGFYFAYQLVFFLAALSFIYILTSNLYRSRDKITDLVSGRVPEALGEQPYLNEWKDYYGILRLKPNARTRDIEIAYRQLAKLLSGNRVKKKPQVKVYSHRMAEVKEAYDVLSDSIRREAYDNEFKARYVVNVLTPPRRRPRKVGKFEVPEGAMRIAGFSFASLIFILIAGTSFAFAHPSQALAAPFRGTAIKVAEVSAEAINMIGEMRGIVAMYERSIISTALQSMRVIDGLRIVPEVTVPTNDMLKFPSSAHPLYPDYLETRYSEFLYTVDSNGSVQVDDSTATTDGFLIKINEVLSQLKEEQ